MKTITVTAPASSANLGPGFDTLALALSLENRLAVEPAGQLTVEIRGEGEDTLPADGGNLACRTMERFYAEIGQALPAMRLVMENRIPLARGLGSSAATIVGGLTVANTLAGLPLSTEDLLQVAAQLEGHADNVAAALYGSLTIVYHDGGRYRAEVVEPDAGIKPILLIPEATLDTSVARRALPESLTYDQAVFNLSRVALLITGLATGDGERLAVAVQDRLHQPYRERLVPNFRQVVEVCYGAGAAGVALSGAGPSLLALAVGDGEGVARAIGTKLSGLGLAYRVLALEIQRHGARSLPR